MILVSKTNLCLGANPITLAPAAFDHNVTCIPIPCRMLAAAVQAVQNPFDTYTKFVTAHHGECDPVLRNKQKQLHNKHLFIHFRNVYKAKVFTNLEWHCIVVPKSILDYLFLVCRQVRLNCCLALNNSQMQDPFFWQHLHTNPRSDLFFRFYLITTSQKNGVNNVAVVVLILLCLVCCFPFLFTKFTPISALDRLHFWSNFDFDCKLSISSSCSSAPYKYSAMEIFLDSSTVFFFVKLANF